MLCEVVKRNQPLLETYCFHTFQSLLREGSESINKLLVFTRYSGYPFRCAESLLNYRFMMMLRATFYQDPTSAFPEPLTLMSVQISSRDLIFVIWPVDIMHPRNYKKTDVRILDSGRFIFGPVQENASCPDWCERDPAFLRFQTRRFPFQKKKVSERRFQKEGCK